MVVLSVASAVAVSVPEVKAVTWAAQWCAFLEVVSSIFFIMEYVVRVVGYGPRRCKYVVSCLGVVDLFVALIAVPTLIDKLIDFWNKGCHLNGQEATRATGCLGHVFSVYHFLECLRMMRLLKILQYIREVQLLSYALRKDMRFISVFLFGVFVVVLLLGSCFYVVEGGQNTMNSIPAGMWWATVTICTVGYGDIVPATVLGKVIAMLIMLIGYGLIAIPTLIGTFQTHKALSQASGSLPDLAKDGLVLLPPRASDCDAETGLVQPGAGFGLLEEAIGAWSQKNQEPCPRSVLEHWFCVGTQRLCDGHSFVAQVQRSYLSSSSCEFVVSLYCSSCYADETKEILAQGGVRYSHRAKGQQAPL
ncbi:KCNB1 [Symbiodinium natans]|uniref:KCNB1 protein n=1 Tax=Symbiodinium natans TaxID=878477 RepID=A0A812UEV3_9DINO|nr:KCNB1 [Symbiodinium natans]